MSEPLLLPDDELVAAAWLRLVLPDAVGVDLELPKAADAPDGFVRVPLVGGDSDRDVPRRTPVIAAECWFPPNPRTGKAPWSRAKQVAQRIWLATYDPDLMNVEVDLSTFGGYASARVATVIALSLPERVENDQSGWARLDLDLLFTWIGAA